MLITGLLFLGYSLISGVLFFRDERALVVFNNPVLWEIRDRLLILKLNTVPTLIFALILAGLFYFYFRQKEELNKKKIIFFAVMFQIIVFFSYPVLSTDIFSYILSDRIAVVYHQNVWQTRPDRFKTDPYFRLSDWTDQTRIYGGVNQIFYSAATSLSGNGYVENIISHKAVVLIFVMLTLLLIPAAVVFWNPLFIIETVGSGHNDIIMLFFTVLSLKLLNKDKTLLSALALGLATQVKTVPALLFVFLAIKLFSDLKIKKLLIFVSTYLATVLVVYYFMGINPLDTVTRTAGSINVYWQSLPMLIRSPLLNFGLLIVLAVQAYRSLIYRVNAVEIFVQTMFFYLLFFLAAFWNWYPIWLLVLIPFLEPGTKIKPYILALTASSMFGYVAYWVSLRLNYQLFIWPVIIYLTVLSGPLLLCLRNIKKKYLS